VPEIQGNKNNSNSTVFGAKEKARNCFYDIKQLDFEKIT
jgi:hypothetical protein